MYTNVMYRMERTKSNGNMQAAGRIDLELLAFLERYANGLIKWDIVTFFARNPNTHDTAENIARYLGRSPQAVAPELADLALLGLLHRFRRGERVIYQLTSDPKLRELTFSFLQESEKGRSDHRSH